MRFSKKTEYGLLALIAMAIEQERGGGRLTTRDIAARQRIPERFLEQQITALRNAGMVHSHRGALGGCALARRAAAITVLEVVEALEGAILEPSGEDGDEGEHHEVGSIVELVGRAQILLSELFRSVTIADLARRQEELREQASQMFYV